MINSRKKGFTLVELVIVIAVVAILAAVLIPTFSNLIKKANISADQQAVVQMNKILAMDEVSDPKPTTTDKVTEILIKNGYSDDLTTYYSNYKLAWILESNVIVLVEDNKVVFPEKYAGATNFEELRPMLKDGDDILGALESGKTVFIAEDVTAKESSDLHFNTEGNFELNLNGNTILTNVPNTVKGYQDGLVVNEKANLVISNGTIEGGNDVSQVIAVYDEASLEIKDSIVTGGKSIAVLAEDGGTITISDSKIFGIGINPIQNYGGTLTLNNVTVAQSGESDGQYYYNSAILVANLYEEREGTKYLTGTPSKTIINGGNYSGKNTIYVVLTGGDVTINDGKFVGTEYVINAGFGGAYPENSPSFTSVITINGGNFDGKISVSAATVLIINGGTFTNTGMSFDTFKTYVASNKTLIDNGNGTWTVK